MTILMSAKPPKAEVSLSRFDVRYVPTADIQWRVGHVRKMPLPEVAMPAEEPSTASITEVTGEASVAVVCRPTGRNNPRGWKSN